jgi:hypothetical protein
MLSLVTRPTSVLNRRRIRPQTMTLAAVQQRENMTSSLKVNMFITSAVNSAIQNIFLKRSEIGRGGYFLGGIYLHSLATACTYN